MKDKEVFVVLWYEKDGYNGYITNIAGVFDNEKDFEPYKKDFEVHKIILNKDYLKELNNKLTKKERK